MTPSCPETVDIARRGAFRVTAVSDAYYRQLAANEFEPTEHVQGAWAQVEQHMSPVGGLLAHAIENHEPRPELQLARINYEILGQIRLAPTTVRVEVVRPGRTIELVQATAEIDGRVVVRANAWRLLRGDTSAVAGTEDEPMPGPDDFPDWDGTQAWPGGYIASLQLRRDPLTRPGRGRTWVRSDKALVAGSPTTSVAHFLRLVDTANGVATRQDPRVWMFPNTDLTVHLYRTPVGDWVGFDTSVSFGPTGVGLTSSILHDVEGPVGRAEQILTVRPLG
ncbi:thioesterase [Enemella evansiae]|nr:thioesterase [Enemella evansiae]